MASSATIIQGKCMAMCPKSEILWREKEKLLHKFESDDSRLRADPARCVKQFSRCAAGQKAMDPKDVRPTPTLVKTVRYLVERILCNEDDDWGTIYEFVFDRFRAVRQDLVVQAVFADSDYAKILECVVRFHIYSIYKLCEYPVALFDAHINSNHLQECLKRLLIFYLEQQDNPSVNLENRCEMEIYYLLFNLGSSDALRHALTLPASISCQPVFRLAYDVSVSWINGNFVRVCRKIRNLPFLPCISAMPHIRRIQRFAIQLMSTGHSSKNCKFPLNDLADLLLFETSTEAEQACAHFGLDVFNGNVCFYKPKFQSNQPLENTIQYRFLREKHGKLKLADVLWNHNDVNVTMN